MASILHTPPYLGDFQEGSTVYLFWNTFGSSGESLTQTGLAVTDIEIYRDGSMTQRASDSGYTLLGTTGTDLDGATGCHGVSIDLSDNSDAGFFARSHDYAVIINAVTVNGQTLRFFGGAFSIQNRFNSSGVGDYAVTLTIRTTAGTPIPGVSVWVNTSNTRSGSVAGTKVTGSDGSVTFNLTYTTFYVFCHLAGYTFAAASFTASAGNVSFTKDIGTAASTGASSDYAQSFLTRAIADVREAIDDPATGAKYTDTRIIDHLEKAYLIVLGEINRTSKTPVVAKINKTVSSGTTKYKLPHIVGSVLGVYHEETDTGTRVYYDGRGPYNPFGRGIWFEGQTMCIQSVETYGVGTILTLEFIPSGIARLHNGTCTISADGLSVTFGATPNSGTLDTHDNAYAGSVLRILGVDGTTVTGNYLQEATITAYNNVTRVATLDVALSPIPTTDDGNIYYEVAPAIFKGMDMILAVYAAYQIMTIEGNLKRASGIQKRYQNEIRNVRLTAYYSNMPEAPRMRSDSDQNRRYRKFT